MKQIQLPPGRWIEARIAEPPKPRKTLYYDVVPKDGGMEIGTIQWFGPFRRYSFFPEIDTVYEQNCLQVITSWLQILDREHSKQVEQERKEAGKAVQVGIFKEAGK